MFTPNIPPKLDTAARHIETASLLQAMQADPRAIHMLVMAADELIGAYARATGRALVLDVDSAIRDDKMGLWLSAKRKAYNYFKHADRDPLADYDGPPLDKLLVLNELGILQSWTNLRALGVKLADFVQWGPKAAGIFYPDMIKWELLPDEAHEALRSLKEKDTRTELRRLTLSAALKELPALAEDMDVALQFKDSVGAAI